jgi:hypothetical protein
MAHKDRSSSTLSFRLVVGCLLFSFANFFPCLQRITKLVAGMSFFGPKYRVNSQMGQGALQMWPQENLSQEEHS